MKLGMSTACSGVSELTAAIEMAGKAGLDAVEISAEHLAGLITGLLTGDTTASAARVREVAASAKVSIAALQTQLTCSMGGEDGQSVAAELRSRVDLAEQLGCGIVIVSAPRVPRGVHPAGAGAHIGQWLMAQADYAAERRVMIGVRNSNSFARVSELWNILETVQHPSVGCCWDMVMSRMMGESFWQAVPVMNLRIVDVHLSDAQSEAEGGWLSTALGEGEVGIKSAIERLRGIGYRGLATIVPPCIGGPGMETLATLTATAQKLRGWIDPPKPAPAKPAAAKPAAKPVGAVAKPAGAKPAAAAKPAASESDSGTATATAEPESK